LGSYVHDNTSYPRRYIGTSAENFRPGSQRGRKEDGKRLEKQMLPGVLLSVAVKAARAARLDRLLIYEY
jgi:hypothetical protein